MPAVRSACCTASAAQNGTAHRAPVATGAGRIVVNSSAVPARAIHERPLRPVPGVWILRDERAAGERGRRRARRRHPRWCCRSVRRTGSRRTAYRRALRRPSHTDVRASEADPPSASRIRRSYGHRTNADSLQARCGFARLDRRDHRPSRAPRLRHRRMKMMQLDGERARAHYAEHKGKPFFDGLVEYITSGADRRDGGRRRGRDRRLPATDRRDQSAECGAGIDSRRFRADDRAQSRPRQRRAASAQRELAIFFERQRFRFAAARSRALDQRVVPLESMRGGGRPLIEGVRAREVLDSRGNPTVAVCVGDEFRRGRRSDGAVGRVDRRATRRSNCATAIRNATAARACSKPCAPSTRCSARRSKDWTPPRSARSTSG